MLSFTHNQEVNPISVPIVIGATVPTSSTWWKTMKKGIQQLQAIGGPSVFSPSTLSTPTDTKKGLISPFLRLYLLLCQQRIPFSHAVWALCEVYYPSRRDVSFDLKQQGMTQIVVTHDIQFANQIADQIFELQPNGVQQNDEA